MNHLKVILFGKPEIRQLDDTLLGLPGKAQELLVYLLIHRKHAHSREKLAGELWRDTQSGPSKKYLRQCLWQLQQGLERSGIFGRLPAVQCVQQWISIDPDATKFSDVHQFDETCDRIRDIPGEALSDEQMQAAQAAAALYRGDLLSGWYQDWCMVERERYQSLYFALLDKVIDCATARGHYEQAAAHCMKILTIEYTRELTHRKLMRVHALNGDRSAALRQFELCEAALRKEFAVRPSSQTLACYEQIRAGRPDLRDAPTPSEAQPSPETAVMATVLGELAQIRTTLAALRTDIEAIKAGLAPAALNPTKDGWRDEPTYGAEDVTPIN
ncbi:MAG: hypothetical protein FIA97_01820 [Methylococcaceae bacterium]|nr:hypothetical protein [Methylococcaceae bacterium]